MARARKVKIKRWPKRPKGKRITSSNVKPIRLSSKLTQGTSSGDGGD